MTSASKGRNDVSGISESRAGAKNTFTPSESKRIKNEFIKRYAGRITFKSDDAFSAMYMDRVLDGQALGSFLDQMLSYDLDFYGLMTENPPKSIIITMNQLQNAMQLKSEAVHDLQNAKNLSPETNKKLETSIRKLGEITKEFRGAIRAWRKAKFGDKHLANMIFEVAKSLGIT